MSWKCPSGSELELLELILVPEQVWEVIPEEELVLVSELGLVLVSELGLVLPIVAGSLQTS